MNLPHPFSYRFGRNPAIIAVRLRSPGRRPALRAANRAPSPIWAWSASPTWPPITTKSSITQLPAMPIWAAMHAVPPDLHIVADLHQIIDLGALADHRVAQRAAVDRGAGADLDIVLNDDPAQLRNFDMAGRAKRQSRNRADRSGPPAE